jgi:hypothetical protein
VKGVFDLRVVYLPQAECRDCRWNGTATSRPGSSAGLRSSARRHVKQTGHVVWVVIEDRTVYAPEGEK